MIYTLSIYLYGGLIKLASLWNDKAKKWVAGRSDFWQQKVDIPKDKEVIWFHCASMGEYDQGLPVMQAFKQKKPNCFLLVTFFSPSGYEALKTKSIADHTCYLPLDTPKNAKRFVEQFNPSKVFFVKYEYWLNYIDSCKEKGCSIYGLSSLFRSDQRFFKWYGGRFKHMINKFDHFFLQNDSSAEILRTHGFEHFTVSGDTRYDRVLRRAKEERKNAIFEEWTKEQKKVLVIGSSWPKDEDMILPLINKQVIKDKVIIAPHEVHDQHIKEIEKKLNVPYQKYTELADGSALNPQTNVIILNCIGVLAFAYKYGTTAYVGGAFGTGLHNILEPASFGLPVIFGPEYKKFPEAQEFIDTGIGASIASSDDFISAYEVFSAPNWKTKVRSFVNQKSGATDQVMNYFQ